MGKIALIIDDDADNVQMFQVLLHSLGYTVEARMVVPDIIALVEAIQPAVIITDLFLPQPSLNGFEIIALVKNHPRFRQIPVVAITAIDLPDNQQLAWQNGVDYYLPKPFTRGDLAAALQELSVQ